MIDNLEPKDGLFFGYGWLTYLGVLVISFWGGIVSYMNRQITFSWVSLVAHLLSASFAGLMTFFACEYAHITGPLVGVLCGVASHMGTPALIALFMKMPVVKGFFENTK